jgi:hypothetical protein
MRRADLVEQLSASDAGYHEDELGSMNMAPMRDVHRVIVSDEVVNGMERRDRISLYVLAHGSYCREFGNFW